MSKIFPNYVSPELQTFSLCNINFSSPWLVFVKSGMIFSYCNTLLLWETFYKTTVFYLSKMSTSLLWSVGLTSLSCYWSWDAEKTAHLGIFLLASNDVCMAVDVLLVFDSSSWWWLLRYAMLSSPDDPCCTEKIGGGKKCRGSGNILCSDCKMHGWYLMYIALDRRMCAPISKGVFAVESLSHFL